MFGSARPGTKLRFDVAGLGWSHDQIVTYPNAWASVAVTLTTSDVAPADNAAGGAASRITSPGPTDRAAAPMPLRVSRMRFGTVVVAAASTGVAGVVVANAPTVTVEISPRPKRPAS